MANRDSKWTHLVSNGKVVLDAVPEIDLVSLRLAFFFSLFVCSAKCTARALTPAIIKAYTLGMVLSVDSEIEFFESPPLFVVRDCCESLQFVPIPEFQMAPMAHLPLLHCDFLCSYFLFRAALGFFVAYNFIFQDFIFLSLYPCSCRSQPANLSPVIFSS